MSLLKHPTSIKPLKLDSLGRRNNGWLKAGPGRPLSVYSETISSRFDTVTMIAIRKVAKKQNKSIAEKLREYVEWGLENEE